MLYINAMQCYSGYQISCYIISKKHSCYIADVKKHPNHPSTHIFPHLKHLLNFFFFFCDFFFKLEFGLNLKTNTNISSLPGVVKMKAGKTKSLKISVSQC